MIKGIIFDFDGVIVDSIKAKSDAFANLYKKYDKEIVQQVRDHHEANGGISRFEKIKFYHQSFLNKKITNKEINELCNRFSSIVVDKVIDSPYILGSLDYIKKNYKKFKLFISTGTPTFEINQILKAKGINHFFIETFGSPSSKINHINKIILKYKLNSNDLIFYGDTLTDLNAARIAEIPFVLVENDFNKIFFKTYKGQKIKNFLEIL